MNNLQKLARREVLQWAKNMTVRQCSKATSHKPVTCLTEDEQMMKETVARLATEKIQPLVSKMDIEEKFDQSVLDALFENGLMGVEVDTKYGGTGSGFMTTVLVVEELSKICGAVGTLVDVHNTLVNSLLIELATEKQKEKYLTALSTKSAGSFCLSEPSSGSDAFALKTTAKQDGDDFLINGTKMWISNSDIADVFVVFANSNPEKGYKGISCFILDRDMPGLTVGKKEKKLGINASGTCMIHFDNVRVPKENIVGELGKGYKYAIGTLNEGRIGIAAQMIGVAQGCFDATIPYTLERKQFGKPIFSFQSMQHQIAQVATEIECARVLTYNAARMYEGGNKNIAKEAAMAKLYASEVAQRATIKCVDWMGGVGFTKDFPQEKYYRDCKIGAIYEGTSNMQLTTIAKIIESEYKAK